MTRPGLTLRTNIFAVAVAIVCAIAAVGGLSALTKPSQFQARLDATAADAVTASRLMRASRGQAAFPAGSACAGQPAEAAARLSSELAGLAARDHLDRPRILVAPADAGPADAGLAPIRVQFEASGAYDAVIGVLDHLSGLRPVLFVDTVDLTPKTSFVTLALSGHVYCSAQR